MQYKKMLPLFVSISVLSAFADNPTLPMAQTYSSGITYRGVSLSGAEFEGGQANQGEFIPQVSDASLFLYRGMNIYRVPIAWEYAADINGNLNTGSTYFTNLDNLIGTDATPNTGLTASSPNAYVLLDLHNYMRYNPNDISQDYNDHDPNGTDIIGYGSAAPTTAAYATLWSNLVQRYHNANMIYDIMNEPHDMTMAQVLTNVNAAIQAIRATEQKNHYPTHLIMVEGNNWTGLHSWTGLGLNPPNLADSQYFIPASSSGSNGIYDPQHKFAIEVHQYFDPDGSGTYNSNNNGDGTGDCLSESDFLNGYSYNGQQSPGFTQYWQAFTTWAQQNKIQVFLGEFGSPDTANCRADITDLMKALNNFAYDPTKGYGVSGWSVWSAGGSWGNYVNSIAPGGPANTLMWNNELYQNYLTETQPLPPLGEKMMALTNNSQTVFLYSSGNWPFQQPGSASLNPGQTVYLYSPSTTTNSPQGQYQLVFHVGDNTGTILQIGEANGWGFPNNQLSNFDLTSPLTNPCDGIKADNGDQKRCWVITAAKK